MTRARSAVARHAIAGASAALQLSVASISAAADPQEATASMAVEESGLAEIVVTARRRDEHEQETPISLRVFDAAALERAQLDNLPDLAARTANLRESGGPQGGSSAHYFMRGVGQLDFIASTDPGVGTYVNGVYLGRTTGAALELVDVERVEVLRGPQGTLYGKNAIGGAINVVSAAPPTERRLRWFAGAGSRARAELGLQAGGPLGDGALRGELALRARTEQGWQTRLVDGGRFGDRRSLAASSTLQWRVGDRLAFTLNMDGTHDRGTAAPHFLLAASADRGGRPQYVVSDPAQTWAGQFSPNDLDVLGTAVTMDLDTHAGRMRAISSWRRLRSATGADFDGSPYPDLDQRVNTHQSQWSQELQWSRDYAQGRGNALVGLYAYGEQVQQAIPVVFYGTQIDQNNDLHNTSYALYAHGQLPLAKRLDLALGMRFSREAKSHGFDNAIVDGNSRVPLFTPTTLHDHWSSLTPRADLEFHLRTDTLLYVSVAQGFRSGGFNGRPLGTDEFLAYDPETLTTVEFGFKAEWFQHRLRSNAAAFTSNYRDIQLTRTATGAGGTPIVVTGNAGTARVSGFELEIQAAPTSRWTLGADVGYLDNYYTELAPGAAVPVGAALPVSPRWTIAADTDYARAISAQLRMRMHLDASYTTRFNYFFDNPTLSWQSGFAIANLSLGMESMRRGWKLTLSVRNLTDRAHSAFLEDVRASYGVAEAWPARPREIFMEYSRSL